MKRLIIKRSKWIRGKSKGLSMLLRKTDGRMCCLGFLSKKLGYTDEEIKGKFTPFDLNTVSCKLSKTLYSEDNKEEEEGYNFMRINDDSNISHQEREKKLRKLFKKINIDVRFVD